MVVAATITVPIGIAGAGPQLFSVHVLSFGLALAVVSIALPYSIEMIAMPRIPAKTVGVLIWTAIASIMVASAGSAATHVETAKSLPD